MSDSDSSWISCSSSSSSSSSDDDIEIEKEILQTIKSDPDLLMKIIEKSKMLNIPLGTLIEDLRRIEAPTSPKIRQKGILDIEPCKVEEARKGSGSGSGSGASGASADKNKN